MNSRRTRIRAERAYTLEHLTDGRWVFLQHERPRCEWNPTWPAAAILLATAAAIHAETQLQIRWHRVRSTPDKTLYRALRTSARPRRDPPPEGEKDGQPHHPCQGCPPRPTG